MTLEEQIRKKIVSEVESLTEFGVWPQELVEEVIVNQCLAYMKRKTTREFVQKELEKQLKLMVPKLVKSAVDNVSIGCEY